MFNQEGAADSASRPRSWRLLAVDDDPVQQQLLVGIFRKTPTIDVVIAADGESALGTISNNPPDIVLLDVSMPGRGGLEVLQKLKAAAPRVPVVVITATSDVRVAVEAIQLGAYQFLTKPVNHQELVVIVKRALERTELLAELERLRHRADGGDPLANRFGSSPPMQLVTRQIRQVAGSHFTVLVQGQTGVGKEVVARAVHDLSPRAAGPFVAIDCGANPENHRSAVPINPTSLREIADAAIETAEREAIMRALQSTKGNKSQAARLLHVDFKTLHLKMRRYGITISHHAES